MIDFFEFSNEMLCLADLEGRLTRVNAAWTRTLGWTADDLTSKPYIEFVHPDDREATLREAALLGTGNHETVWFENRYRRIDGTYRWLAWRAKVVAGRLVASARDITDLRRALDALQEERQLLRDLLDVQECEKQFLCHEFHDGLIQYAVAALMDLDGLAERHADREDAAVLRNAVANLRRGVEDGRRVIRGIRPSVLDDYGAAAAVDDLVGQYADSGIHVTSLCDPDIGRLPASMQTTIYRVAQEALNNARKHSGTDVVRIELRKVDDEVRLTVRDFGVGFDAAAVRGRGFGLRGMTERVRLLGGDCTIESRVGEGTTVVARLPIVPET